MENLKDFKFHGLGLDTETTWDGDFTIKLSLSPADLLRADQIKRDCLGNTNGAPPDDNSLYIAQMVSQLAVRIKKAPDWWKDSSNGLNLADSNILEEVFSKAWEYIEAYMKERSEKAKKAKAEIDSKIKEEQKF